MKIKIKIKKYQRVLIFVFFISQIFLLTSQNAIALEIIYPPVPGAETPQDFLQTCSPSDAFPLYIKYFYHFLVTMSGIVCFGVVVWGGLLYLLSLGSAVKMAEGIGKISAGFLGITIILTSYMLIKAIDPQLLTLTINKPDIPQPIFPDIPTIQDGLVEYVEIPVGGLIDKVRASSTSAKNVSKQLKDEAIILKNLDKCLKRISDECDCSSIDTENCDCCNCANSGCDCGTQCPDCANYPDCSGCTSANCPSDQDPCDINPFGLTAICLDLVGLVPANVRDAMSEITSKIDLQINVVEEKKAEVEQARRVLDFSNQRLKIAEALIRDSLFSPISFDSFVSLDGVKAKKLWAYEDISMDNDSATFYISYKDNKDIIAIVEGLLTQFPPMGPRPDFDWMPGDYNGTPPSTQDVESYASNASDLTGVRASLILALLSYESGYRQFPGTGHYSYDLCGHPNCEAFGDINCYSFEHIWIEMTQSISGLYQGDDINGDPFSFFIHEIPLSAAGEYCASGECLPHCGGAMGPAQAMSYTWIDFENQLKAITGKESVSPWDFGDAFTFTGLHLKERGNANTQICADEAYSVWRYVGGHRDHAYNMVELANKISETIKGEYYCFE